MRHAMRFLLCPNSFWSSLMVAKYDTWMMSDDIRSAQINSFMWREICTKALGVMTQIRWVVGDGCITDLFHDSWISHLPLCLWPTFISVEIGCSSTILDLLHPKGGGWRFDRVAQLFSPDLAECCLLRSPLMELGILKCGFLMQVEGEGQRPLCCVLGLQPET